MLMAKAVEAATYDPLAVIAVTAAFTLLGGVIVGAVTAWLSRRSEQGKWLREKQFEALLAFLELADAVRYRDYLDLPQDQSEEALMRMQAVASLVGFIGAKKIRKSSERLQGAIALLAEATPGDEKESALVVFNDARKQYVDTARRILKTEH